MQAVERALRAADITIAQDMQVEWSMSCCAITSPSFRARSNSSACLWA
jgi:hypothetical protein